MKLFFAFEGKNRHISLALMPNQPLAVCDKTAGNLKTLERNGIYIRESTWFYDGGGCC